MAGDDGHAEQPSLGLIGFGAFGRLIARDLRDHFPIQAYDPAGPSSGHDAELGVSFANAADVAGCDIVVLAMPVERLAEAIALIAPHLRPGALVLDVGSVKVGPAEVMARDLPPHVDIIGTHPLFGPQSARDGLSGLRIALCPIRGDRAPRVAAFLRKALGLKVYVVTPQDHDREAAIVQGLTHLIAKVLVRMEPLPTRMTTTSFDMLVRATAMVRHDAPEVFLAIMRANPYAAEVRERFFELAAELRASLEADEA